PYVIPKEELDIPSSFEKAHIPNEFNGSNNWVIAGSKSESGMPLLADDPHLGLGAPSVWYQTRLQSDEQNVSGVIFAGVPGIILGHNEQIAWGVTNVGPDVQDLYIEKRNPDNPEQFLYKGKWEDAVVINEPISVKGGEVIDYDVTITRHGPVISEFAKGTDSDTVLSMRWTALEETHDLQALPGMNKAKNWEEFDAALVHFKAPASNFVYADKEGNIAYKVNGNIPIREKGSSLVPVPGWTGEYEWTGYIPHNELPTLINPEQGYIATANNKIVDDRYPYHISHTWAQPYRQERILEVLGSKDMFTLQDMKDLQMDVFNKQAEEFLPMFKKALSKQKLSAEQQQALDILSEWNLEDDKDQAAPLLFHTLMLQISEELFGKDIPVEMMDMFEGRANVVDELLRKANEGTPGPWVRDAGGMSVLIQKSLENTITLLTERYGAQMEDWKWGDEHQLQFVHPLSNVKPLNIFFNSKKPIPVSGSRITVQSADRNVETGIVNHGASWRFVIDLNDLSKGHHIVGPGQAGHFKSEWYDNQVEDWANGTYHVTELQPKVEANRTLTLNPAEK
ncbi:MAG: penicillin acylase family protein, partial [Bacilli bacterium]